MIKIARLGLMLAILFLAGCATATPTSVPPTPTNASKPTGVVALPTLTASSTPVSTLVPTSTLALPTATPSATATALATPPAAVSATATLPPGVFMSNLRIDPNPPARGTELTFYATFVNTTAAMQNYKWIVYVYRADTLTKPYGETTALASSIAVGTNEVKGGGSWKIAVGGPCENFIARPVWLDKDNQPVNFNQPNGKVFEKAFTVCAPVDLPTSSPAPSPTPTATPTFAPGLFAIDLRTEPSPPTRGSELAFYITFVNTTGSPQTQKWNIYIYKPGDRNSIGETTATTTMLANGINEYRTIGAWNSGPGPCQDYVIRVHWFDNENKTIPFTGFANLPFEKTIQVCPP